MLTSPSLGEDLKYICMEGESIEDNWKKLNANWLPYDRIKNTPGHLHPNVWKSFLVKIMLAQRYATRVYKTVEECKSAIPGGREIIEWTFKYLNLYKLIVLFKS